MPADERPHGDEKSVVKILFVNTGPLRVEHRPGATEWLTLLDDYELRSLHRVTGDLIEKVDAKTGP